MRIKEQDERRIVMTAGFFEKIEIDKMTMTINMRTMSTLFRKRVIPFSDVRTVVIDYEAEAKTSGYAAGARVDAWKVSIDIAGKKFKIDRTRNKENMFHLASEISSFIGTELVDNSAIPEISLVRIFEKVEGLFVKVLRKEEHARRQARREEAKESSKRRMQELDRIISNMDADKKQKGKP